MATRPATSARGWLTIPLRLAMSVSLAFTVTACAPAPIGGTGYRIVFQDTFDGPGVDLATWATAPFGGSLPATVADGVLTLRATATNGHRWGYLATTGPRSETEPNYPRARAWQEGYFEARIRYSDNAWAWPAFWLFGMAKTEAWPDENCWFLNTEWDIMENGVQNEEGLRPASRWYFTALHRNTTDNTPEGYCGQPDTQATYAQHFPGVDLSDWHVWAGRWTSDEMCTYLDGHQIQCVEPYDATAQPMHVVFTIQYLGRCDACGERPPELEMQVDWLTVWQLP